MMAILRAAVHGFRYASQLRFAHAFVMGILFGKGTLKEKLIWAVKMSLKHGFILALFAFCYKSVQCLLTNLRQKNRPWHSFVAGVFGSAMLIYFDTDMSINRQVGYYLAARVLEGIVLNFMNKLEALPEQAKSFRFVLSVSWAFVMMFFVHNEKLLNRSLASSLHEIYD